MRFINKFSRNGLFYCACGETMYSQKTLALGIGRMVPRLDTNDRYLSVMACFIFGWANVGIRIRRGGRDA